MNKDVFCAYFVFSSYSLTLVNKFQTGLVPEIVFIVFHQCYMTIFVYTDQFFCHCVFILICTNSWLVIFAWLYFAFFLLLAESYDTIKKSINIFDMSQSCNTSICKVKSQTTHRKTIRTVRSCRAKLVQK